MKGALKYLALITQVGLTILITVSFFTFLGVYLDRHLKTRGILTLIGILLGCFAGIWSVYQLIPRITPKDSEPK